MKKGANSDLKHTLPHMKETIIDVTYVETYLDEVE